MPLTNQTNDKLYYTAAVYRFEDTCVRLQEGMQGYYRTASIEAVDGIEAVFRWFSRRGVQNILFTELASADVETLLERLHWNAQFLADNNVRVLSYQPQRQNPFQQLIQDFNLKSGKQLITIGDQPDFLNKSWAAGVEINLGVTYGTCNYQQLEKAPKTGLLDTILELPNFIIEYGISQERQVEPAKKSILSMVPSPKAPLRLYLRLPFF